MKIQQQIVIQLHRTNFFGQCYKQDQNPETKIAWLETKSTEIKTKTLDSKAR